MVVVFTLGKYVQQTFSQTCTTFHDQLTNSSQWQLHLRRPRHCVTSGS